MKEYTYIEFNEMVEKNDLEVFSKSQVDQFSRDYLANRDMMDEFEKSCAEVDYASLTACVVVNEDLTKSIVYYRENQTESIIPEGIFKSIDDKKCRRFKETPLNIFKGIAGINCADKDVIEKAKALPIGTEKTYGGKLYIKTAKGWRLKPKGTKNGQATLKESDKKETKTTVQESNKGEKNFYSIGKELGLKRNENGKWDIVSHNIFNESGPKSSVLNTKINDEKLLGEIASNIANQFKGKNYDWSKTLDRDSAFNKISSAVSKELSSKIELDPSDIKIGMTVQRNTDPNGTKYTVKGKDEKGKFILESQDGKTEKTSSPLYDSKKTISQNALIGEVYKKILNLK